VTIGVRVKPASWFSAQLVGFRLETTDDFIQDPVTREYENAGETTRDGFEVALDFFAFDHGYLHADYAYIDAQYDRYTSGGVSYDGNTLPGVPEDIINVELGYNAPAGVGGWIRYHYQSGAELDTANTMESDAWNTVDANLFYRFGTAPRYTFALEILNVLDEEYASSISYSGGSLLYSPGLPLSFYASFTVDF